MPAPDDWLDRPCWVLDLGKRGYAPVIWRDELGLAGMLYTEQAPAEAQLQRLRALRPAAKQDGKAGGRLRLLELAAGDPRAREEWLQAVLHAGAARVAFDLDPRRPQPKDFELTGALLAEVLSQRRGLACL